MKKILAQRTILAALLIAMGFGIQPLRAAYWQWSRTASLNGSADPSINFQEGMSPSSVNDSARALMARAAEERDDISGLLTTAGTSTAYTVTTNQGLNTPIPSDGQMIAITMSATNGINATLAADGGTAYPIQASPGIAAPAATMISGSPYSLKFSVANGAWMLRNFYGSALTIPLGAMVPFTLSVVPNSNFVFPAGQCLSTTTYAVYWVALGSPASGTCAGGQFRIIDMSGRVPAGLDTMPGFAAANRLTSAAAGCGTAMTSVGAICANGLQSQTLTPSQIPTITALNNNAPSYNLSGGFTSGVDIGVTASATAGGGFAFNAVTSIANASVFGVTIIGANTLSTISNNTGGAAHPIVQPTIGLTYLLRVI